MPAVAPSVPGKNGYYDSDEEYFFALADALHTEYQAIVDAGFVLQVDDPFLSELFSYSGLPEDECRERGELYVASQCESNCHWDADLSTAPVDLRTCFGPGTDAENVYSETRSTAKAAGEVAPAKTTDIAPRRRRYPPAGCLAVKTD